ncbi:ATP-grasp domain-containing protein [Hymenobacter sp. GOD-10R]|uniref:ATP-grasp domain-containing protein n=1 Tax=Hymenobacter sp. GOD-10R TaxID=3093922 RepID=UPI002D7730DD|nr:ATP-grasp domain-containing protein [Hymenobacter sp. GOD-10R]WRQ31685.1 ATP-grasp domain-containing protein [Hymenobacter sp. GOD-10R]
MLNLLFPSLPYQRVLDPMWQPEAQQAQQRGYSVCLYDAEQQRLYQTSNPAWPTLYRGWMLCEREYRQLAQLTPLFISPELYLASHHATGWYAAIAPFTPASVFAPVHRAALLVEQALQTQGRCFIKTLTKSFGAESVISSVPAFTALVQRHALAADEVLFIRSYQELSTQPEERYFAIQGQPYGAAGKRFPVELQPVLAQLQSRWLYTLDVAYTISGTPLIIEVGDGQVSDTKEWPVAELYQTVLQQLAEQAAS